MISAVVRMSIRAPGVVVALAILLVAYGLYTLQRARVDVFPEFAPTQVVVQTEAAGLSAELVETLVTQRIENALLGVSGVEGIRSQSIPGLSVVTVLFVEGTDIYRDRQVVAERINALSAQMPVGVSPRRSRRSPRRPARSSASGSPRSTGPWPTSERWRTRRSVLICSR